MPYYKLAKILLDPQQDFPLPATLIVRDNQVRLRSDIDSQIEKPIEDPVLINLALDQLRNPYGARPYKFRFYNDAGLWVKIRCEEALLDRIGDEYLRAPDSLANLFMAIDSGTEAGINIEYSDDDIKTYVNVPVDTYVPPYYLRYLNLEPYLYQQHNIAWLRNTEEAISAGRHGLPYITCGNLTIVRLRDTTIYMDPKSRLVYNQDSIWDSDRAKHCALRGGVLCDEMGLGKTLSMVGLILADKYRNERIQSVTGGKKIQVSARKKAPSPADEDDDIARAETSSEISHKKLTLKIKRKEDTASVHTPPIPTTPPTPPKKVLIKLKPRIDRPEPTRTNEDDDTSSVDPDEGSESSGATELDSCTPLIETTATLVLCPRRLVGQWIDEIHKYTNSLTTTELSTMINVNKLTYDIFEGPNCPDVVVASFSLLDNKNYINQSRFKMSHIKWRRVIVDEGHEVLLHQLKKKATDLRISTGIFSIQSTFRWVCTGTPLPFKQQSLQAIISFLCGLRHNQLEPVLAHLGKTDYNSLLELVFHRNTQASTKAQIHIPKVEEQVHMLDFTATERAIYDAETDNERKLQICTNINVTNNKDGVLGGAVMSLDQANKAMAAHYKNRCDAAEAEIDEFQAKGFELEAKRDEECAHIENRLATLEAERKGTPPAQRSEIDAEITDLKEQKRKILVNTKGRLDTVTRNIARLEEEIKEAQKQIQIFRALDTEHISNAKCPVLGTPLKGQSVVITPAGYYYSEEAVTLLLGGSSKKDQFMCPLQRTPIWRSELVVVAPKQEVGSEGDMERSKWGTKMMSVVRKLQEIFKADDTDRVIIFSRWTKMLTLMVNVLRDYKIPCVMCQGNVHMMKKSIRSFKRDPVMKVILLSSESCSSGSNLTEASHVFLIDAVGDDIEAARAIEDQAIGRAKRLGQTKDVHIHRFVVKDTIEEVYYRNMTERKT